MSLRGYLGFCLFRLPRMRPRGRPFRLETGPSVPPPNPSGMLPLCVQGKYKRQLTVTVTMDLCNMLDTKHTTRLLDTPTSFDLTPQLCFGNDTIALASTPTGEKGVKGLRPGEEGRMVRNGWQLRRHLTQLTRKWDSCQGSDSIEYEKFVFQVVFLGTPGIETFPVLLRSPGTYGPLKSSMSVQCPVRFTRGWWRRYDVCVRHPSSCPLGLPV